ncbi:AAA family ATPase [Micromonospora sp. HK10]|uniref:AAA family ATPase n=1 Tax=Micromonospora sp. HK10 TaxID=1538294 RepID=UPI000697C671|nr:AAA family ATPase [Micromonospora sp. HK10]
MTGALTRELATNRGLKPQIITAAGIGWDGERYVLPVYDAGSGDLVDLQTYRIGGHLHHRRGGTPRLYAPDGFDSSRPVLVCEGAWDVLAAREHGLNAVGVTGGAGAVPGDLSALQGCDVVTVYDSDGAGQAGAAKLAKALAPIARSVRVADLGLPDKGDVRDWFITHGRTADDLMAVVGQAQPWGGEDGGRASAGGFITLADVEEEELRWLWSGRIPRGKLTILEGDPDLGKSMVTCDLVARVTTGAPFPGSSERRQPQDVIIVLAEDDLNDTVRPRLRAAGADLHRVHSIALGRDDDGNLLPLSIPEDLHRMRDGVKRFGAGLVVIDPITAFLSESINSHNDASVRRAMTPLAEMAQTTGAAVLMIRHLNKSGDMKALYRGGGSIAFIGAARSGLVVDRHPDDPVNVRVLAQVKANLAKNHRPSIVYHVEGWERDDAIPVVRWGETIELTAEDLLKKPDGRKRSPERDEAERFLITLLRGQEPVPVSEVQRQAEAAGLKWATVRRAKDGAGVQAIPERKESGAVDKWLWTIQKTTVIELDAPRSSRSRR